ncbi:MAG: hypothetical protein R3B06_03250 [Kofleriaceae bacterium]
MDLRALRRVLVAAALCGCGPAVQGHAGGGPGPVAVDRAPTGPAVVDQAFVVDEAVHASARWRWVSKAELVLALAPRQPDDVELQLFQRHGWAPVWSVAARPLTPPPPRPGEVAAYRDRADQLRMITVDELAAARDRAAVALGAAAAGDARLRAFDHLLAGQLAGPGVWVARDGAVQDDVPVELLAPSPDEPVAGPRGGGWDAARADALRPVIAAYRASAAEAALATVADPGERALVRGIVGYRWADDDDVLSQVAVTLTPLAVGWLVQASTPPPRGCPEGAQAGLSVVAVTGAIVVELTAVPPQAGHCRGRRPIGYAPPPAVPSAAPLAAFFVEAAALEAASVTAFTQLAGALDRLGAPTLAARARAAAVDEAHHAALMAARARAAGVSPAAAPAVTGGAPVDAFALALDNAVEGCVHECFAALVVAYQADTLAAHAPSLAAEFAAIAADEVAHGQLAWDVAAWLEPQLTPWQRHEVDAARRRALDRLVATPAQAVASCPAPTALALGLPSAAAAQILAAGLARHVA